MPEPRYVKALQDLSKSAPSFYKEWKITSVRDLDLYPDEEETRCVCSQPLTKGTLIYNSITSNAVLIGESCLEDLVRLQTDNKKPRTHHEHGEDAATIADVDEYSKKVRQQVQKRSRCSLCYTRDDVQIKICVTCSAAVPLCLAHGVRPCPACEQLQQYQKNRERVAAAASFA